MLSQDLVESANAILKRPTKTDYHAVPHAVFTYPEVAGVAESLCRLIEHTPEMVIIPTKLVAQHVDAVRAIIREHTRSDVADVATVLTQRLREVTDEFLMRENSFRPDYLQSIFAPSLVPGGGDT